MDLCVEMHRWVGLQTLASLVDSLRSAQKTDFDRLIADRPVTSTPRPLPSLYTRKDRPAPGDLLSADTISTSCYNEEVFVEEVDLPKRIKSTEAMSLLGSSEKWSENLKGLTIVIDIIGGGGGAHPVPRRIKQGTNTNELLHELINLCKTYLRQGHLQLQISSVRLLHVLCEGMGGGFGPIVRPVVGLVMLKLRDKRLVTEAVSALLAFMKHCTPLEVVLDDLIDLLRNKKEPPHAKIGVNDFIDHVCKEMQDKIGSDSLKVSQ